tara:strand:+ start:782 stop:1144 length:363 start_codon:yes stop_codon:yes gene_type:complete
MWVALTEGWLSIVAHRHKPDHLLVRARNPKHITRTFPDAEMYTITSADYPFRADVLREDVIDFIANRLDYMQYDNFKNTIDKQDYGYREVANTVWTVLYQYGIPFRHDNASSNFTEDSSE